MDHCRPNVLYPYLGAISWRMGFGSGLRMPAPPCRSSLQSGNSVPHRQPLWIRSKICGPGHCSSLCRSSTCLQNENHMNICVALNSLKCWSCTVHNRTEINRKLLQTKHLQASKVSPLSLTLCYLKQFISCPASSRSPLLEVGYPLAIYGM